MSEHPGLGEPTDIGAPEAEQQADAPPPATNDAEQYDDQGLGTGDGPSLGGGGGTEPQPGGSG